MSTLQFSVEDDWVVVSSSDTESDGVISLDDDDTDALEQQSALSSSAGNHQGLGSVQDHDGADQILASVHDLDGVDHIEESVGIIQDLGGVDENLSMIRGHGGSFDQCDGYYGGYGDGGGCYQGEEYGDEDYDKGDEAYGLDDELVPWAVSGKFGRQRMRKLGKRPCAKMHTSKRSPYLYVKPGCARGKHGLGLKHSY